MYTIITQRFIDSAFEVSACTVAAAGELASSKQFYRVQLVDEFGCIVWEVKQDEDAILTCEAQAIEKAEKKLNRTALQAIFSPAGSLLGQAVRLER